jgi:predicted transposase YdaD
MFYGEYDRDMDIAVKRREAWEDGHEEGIGVGLAQGREEGLEQGREEEKLIIAKNLLLKGSTPEFIREITGLDMETVKKLAPPP